MVCNLFDNNNETCHFLYNKCQNIIKTCCLETKVTRLLPAFFSFCWNYDNMLHRKGIISSNAINTGEEGARRGIINRENVAVFNI